MTTEYVITEQMRVWGKANGYNVDIHAEFFNDYLANKPGKPYKDLDAAFRNCVRSDWGGLRRANRGANGYTNTRDQERADTIANLTGRSKKPASGATLSTDDGALWEQVR